MTNVVKFQHAFQASAIVQNINGVTQSFIRKLNEVERVETVAQMLSGEKPTKAAVENARELLSLS